MPRPNTEPESTVAQILPMVARARAAMVLSQLVVGVLLWTVTCAGILLVLCLLDNATRLPSALRLPLLLGGLVAAGSAFHRHVLRVLIQRQDMVDTALALESKYQIPHNELVNAMQLEHKPCALGARAFVRALVQTATRRTKGIKMDDVCQMPRLRKWAVGFVVLVCVWGGYVGVCPRHAANAFHRLFVPMSDVPPAGNVVLDVVPGEDTSVFEGQSVKVVVTVAGRGAATLETYPVIAWTEESAEVPPRTPQGQTLTMLPSEERENAYVYTFSAVHRDFAFRVFAGSTYTRSLRVAAFRAASIVTSEFRVKPPGYTGLDVRGLPGPPRPLSGLSGSAVQVGVTLDQTVAAVSWRIGEESVPLEPGAAKSWSAGVDLKRSGLYEVSARVKGLDTPVILATGDVVMRPDLPSTIDFQHTNRNLPVTPGQELSLRLKAADDFGLKEIVLAYRQVDAPADEILKTWGASDPPGFTGTVEKTHTFKIQPSVFAPGGDYIFTAYSRDYCAANRRGESQPLFMHVAEVAELVADGTDVARMFEHLDRAIALEQRCLDRTRNLAVNLADLDAPDKQGALGKIQDTMWREQGRDNRSGVFRIIAVDIGKIGGHTRDQEAQWLWRELKALVAGEPEGAVVTAGTWIGKITQVGKEKLPACLTTLEKLQAGILDKLVALKAANAVAQPSLEDALQLDTEPADELDPVAQDELAPAEDDPVAELSEDMEAFAEMARELTERKEQVIGEKDLADLTEEERETVEALNSQAKELEKFMDNALSRFLGLELDPGQVAMGEKVNEFKDVLDEERAKPQDPDEEEPQWIRDLEEIEDTLELCEEMEMLPEVDGHGIPPPMVSEESEDTAIDVPMPEIAAETMDVIGELLDPDAEAPEADVGMEVDSFTGSGPIADGNVSSMAETGLTGWEKPKDVPAQGKSKGGRQASGVDGKTSAETLENLEQNEYAISQDRFGESPFENQIVKDEDVDAQTGGTGGGSVTDQLGDGFGQQGRSPDSVIQLAEEQIGEQNDLALRAQQIALQLRKYNIPAPDLKQALDDWRSATERGKTGVAIRQQRNKLADALRKAHSQMTNSRGVTRTAQAEYKKARDNLTRGRQTGVSERYETMVAEYFKRLATDE